MGYSREYGKTPNGKNAEAEECRQYPRKPRKKLERDFLEQQVQVELPNVYITTGHSGKSTSRRMVNRAFDLTR